MAMRDPATSIFDDLRRSLEEERRARASTKKKAYSEACVPYEPYEAAKVPEPEVFKDIQLDTKQIISEVYGIEGAGFNCSKFSEDYWEGSPIAALIPTAMPNYVFPDEAVPIILGIEYKEPVNITGPAGTGKSTVVKQIAALRNQPFVRISGKEGLELSSLLGQILLEGEETVWRDGILTQAVRHGALVCVDEWTKLSPGVMMAFQWLLEDDGKLIVEDMPGEINDKVITPHPDFRLVMTDNVKGFGDGLDKYAATNVQDVSTLSRFGVHVTLEYMPADVEAALLKAQYDLSDTTAANMIKVAEKVRQGFERGEYSMTMSIRTLLKWAKFSCLYKDSYTGFKISFLNCLADEHQVTSIRDVYTAVCGK